MSVSKHVLLHQLYKQTTLIMEQLNSIDSNMEKNEPESVEKITLLLEERGQILSQLEASMANDETDWTELDQRHLQLLKRMEEESKPKVQKLLHSFSGQMVKLKQGKKLSQRYQSPYTGFYTDGSFIDQKK